MAKKRKIESYFNWVWTDRGERYMFTNDSKDQINFMRFNYDVQLPRRKYKLIHKKSKIIKKNYKQKRRNYINKK